MKPVEGVRSTGASWVSCMRFAVLPQVAAGYAMLRPCCASKSMSGRLR